MPPDENDSLRAGTLSADPFEGTEPVKVVPIKRGKAEDTPPPAEPFDFEREAPLVGSLVADAVELMRRRARGEALALPTPWPRLNEKLGGGFWPGLHVVTGATGTGKSQLAVQVALAAARAGAPVLYVGLELGKSDLIARLLALMQSDSDARAKWSDLWLGRDPAALERAVQDHGPELAKLPIRFQIAPPYGWNAGEQLIAMASGLRKLHPPSSRPMLVVLDYLQIVAPAAGNPRQDLRERIGQAAYNGRAVARDLDAAVILLSSVSRANVGAMAEDESLGRGDPSRYVGLGKESGEIEFAADTVLAMARGLWIEGQRESEIHVAIAKQRASPPGWASLWFNGGWLWELSEPEETRRRNERANAEAKSQTVKDVARAARSAAGGVSAARLAQALERAKREGRSGEIPIEWLREDPKTEASGEIQFP